MPYKYVRGNVVSNGMGYMYPASELSYTWNHSFRAADSSLILRANAVSRSYTEYRTSARKLGTGATDNKAIFGIAAPQGGLRFNGLYQGVYNRAYAKFVTNLKGDTASLGVTLGGWSQSWAMIAKSANSIAKIAKSALRKEQQRERALEVLRKRVKGRTLGRRDLLPLGSANVFLEWKFGWIPLIGDIYAAAQALGDEIPGDWIHARASDSGAVQEVPPGYGSYVPYGLKWSSRGKCRVAIAAQVRIDNPNLWLLNKLGLINPAVVAWDLVPWSFVANMFVNINAVMNSFTDFVGMSLTNSSVTTRWDVNEQWYVRNFSGAIIPSNGIEETSQVSYMRKTRSPGINLPSLQLRSPSLDRGLALTALSLMTQQVSKLKYFQNSYKGK